VSSASDAAAVRRCRQPRLRAVEPEPRLRRRSTHGTPRAVKSVWIIPASVQRFKCFPCSNGSRRMRPPLSTSRMPNSMSSIEGRGKLRSSKPPIDRNASLRTAPSPAQNVVAMPAALWCTWWWRRFRNSETIPLARGSSSYEPNTPVKAGSAANAMRMRSKASAWTATSESTKTTTSPVAWRTPRFRALAGPAPAGALTTMSSCGGSIAALIARRHSPSDAGASVAGTTTEKEGTKQV